MNQIVGFNILKAPFFYEMIVQRTFSSSRVPLCPTNRCCAAYWCCTFTYSDVNAIF